MKFNLRVWLLALLLLTAASLTACGSETAPTEPAAQATNPAAAPTAEPAVEAPPVEEAPAAPSGTLSVALPTFPNSLDVSSAAERNAQNAAWQLYDSLVWINEAGEMEPALAERWDVSDDGTEYTFYLRQDVTFHNGEPFNAQSVIFSWERASETICSGATAGRGPWPWKRRMNSP
jgi:ABC-type transport system substrate-binding protein